MERERLLIPGNILFVCTGNQCRSPMAEVLFRDCLRKKYGERAAEFTVRSCGTAGIWDAPATEEAIQVMKEEGIDLSAHRSRGISGKLLQEADIVLVMAERHYFYIETFYPLSMPKVHLVKEYGSPESARSFTGSMDIEDPIGKNMEAYRAVLGELNKVFTAIFTKWGKDE